LSSSGQRLLDAPIHASRCVAMLEYAGVQTMHAAPVILCNGVLDSAKQQ